MAILARGDDVKAFLGRIQFAQHGRGDKAALGALAGAEALVLPRRVARQRRAGEVGVCFLVEDEFALRVPGVDVALHVIGHDLRAPVAEQVAGRRGLDHRPVVGGRDLAAGERMLAGVQRQRVGVHRPAGQV